MAALVFQFLCNENVGSSTLGLVSVRRRFARLVVPRLVVSLTTAANGFNAVGSVRTHVDFRKAIPQEASAQPEHGAPFLDSFKHLFVVTLVSYTRDNGAVFLLWF